MFETCKRLLRAFNNIATGNEADLFSSDYHGSCRQISNTLASIKVNGKELYAHPGTSLLPAETTFPAQPKPAAQAVQALALLLCQPGEKVYAHAVTSVTPHETPSSSMTCSQPTFPQHNAAPAALPSAFSRIDRLVNRVISLALPWHPINGQELTPDAATETVTYTSGRENDTALTGSPPEEQNSTRWESDDYDEFYPHAEQQLDLFIEYMAGPVENQQRQQLITMLAEHDLIFLSPSHTTLSRQERALESEMKRRVMVYELELKNKSLVNGTLEARLMEWGDEQTAAGHAVWVRKSGNPLDYVEGVARAVAGELSRTLSDVVSGEIVKRQPGESNGDWLLRLLSNIVMPPEGQARAAFHFKPIKTNVVKPPVKLPGTTVTHKPTGLTLQSVQQAVIAGQEWHLFPTAPGQATAIPVGIPPTRSHTATHNARTQRWSINGVAGEHLFQQRTQPDIYILADNQYHPVTVSPVDGAVILADGRKLYFNQPAGQWRVFHRSNSYLHASSLSMIPESLIRTAPERQQVSFSMAEEKHIWSTPDGRQYLQIYSPGEGADKADRGYVAGRLEGQFFTLSTADNIPPWQQVVLEWRPERQQWQAATSPFSLLQAAEGKIDVTWLQSHPATTTLSAVYHRPGLYRQGNHYFLRWRSDTQGTMHYLKLLPTDHPAQYRLTEENSGHIRFRYDEQEAQWQFLTLTDPAFEGLPDKIKLRFTPPLSPDIALPDYPHAYLSDNDIYLHSGTDHHGASEYIRVEQDSDDSDLFYLNVPNDDGTANLWRFRYNDKRKLTLEEKRLCQRIKRADDAACAGTSGLSRPPSEPAIQQMRGLLAIPPADRAWLVQHPREEAEMLLPDDLTIIWRQKNLHYATRLSRIAPKEMALTSIAGWAVVTTAQLRLSLATTSTAAVRLLRTYPRHPGELRIDYAMRLCRMELPGTSITDIAQHTDQHERSIQMWLKLLPTESKRWLNDHPRNEHESYMAYAMRLSTQPQQTVTLGQIAAHARVDEIALRHMLRTFTPRQQWWLEKHPRYRAESNLNYGIRLALSQQEGLSFAAIAWHANVQEHTLRLRVNQLSQSTQVWLRSVPQQENESVMDYALRLMQHRQQQKQMKQVSTNELALFAGVPHSHLQHTLRRNRQEWFNSVPRLTEETVADNDDEFVIQSKNQRYAQRLTQQRDQQQKLWLISNHDIAINSGLTPESLRQALAMPIPAAPLPAEAKAEVLWQPQRGLLHLEVKTNPPLLVDAKDVTHSLTHDVITQPLWISDVRQIEKSLHMPVGDTFLQHAEQVVKTDGNQQKQWFSEYFDVFYDMQNPQIGMQVTAKKTIPKGTFLGVYTGVWHATEAALRAECKKMGSQQVVKYLWSVKNGEQSVSGFQNANELSLINTGEMPGHPSLGDNNVAIGYINDVMPFYYTSREIKPGEQLLISYGDFYLPDYFVQTSLHNDVFKIIAQKEQKYFVIHDIEDRQAYAFGPNGEISPDELPAKSERYHLKARKDARGVIRYDAISRSGKRRIAISLDDGDNQYHAMAKALYPKAGHDKIEVAIKAMKQEVAAVYAKEGIIVKTEPADPH